VSTLRASTRTTAITAWVFRAAAWLGIAWLLDRRTLELLLVAALLTQSLALLIDASQRRSPMADLLVKAGTAAGLVWLFSAMLEPSVMRRFSSAPRFVPLGIGVFVCHAIAYIVDVRRRTADPQQFGTAMAYLIQLPVFPAGPLSRFHEFSDQFAKTEISMAGFSYGVRRIVTGALKVWAIAGPLSDVASQIFALRVTLLSIDIAWLGAVCAALEVYFAISGLSDIAIGLGRILGFRYQENFRRPYTADSIREFWRRWNVTLITWLRDYLSLPIAGHDVPTAGLYFLTVAGFVVLGAWQRATLHVLPWALYFGSWLAIEAIGLGRLIERLPRPLRHAYVLIGVLPGWILLRASGPGPLLGYVEAMLGFAIMPVGSSLEFMDPLFVVALISGIVFAGPLVSSISRWRVSVDAATASLLMMCAATGVFVWRASLPLVRAVWPTSAPRRP
jgi:D-alanyl-lipoteichoic acid acyltransferase DltB (MBOAT superfamily)